MIETRSHSGSKFLFWLFIIAAVIVAFMTINVMSYNVSLDISHGDSTHGEDAALVRQCIQQKGILQEWYRPLDGHRAFVCQLDDGRFGLQIVKSRSSFIDVVNDILDEITAFKTKYTTTEKLTDYLIRRGYEFVK